jgi:hypothetical protein
VSYLNRPDVGGAVPDYRGGLSFGKGFGRLLGSETAGFFFETNDDAVFVSRFANDTLFYTQNRMGYTLPRLGSFQSQLFWNHNLTADVRREYWANFAETGPGARFRWRGMPPGLAFSVMLLRGAYLTNEGNPRRPNFFDVRVGFWYAVTR